MISSKELLELQMDWVRRATQALRDPFSKTTRERQKQLLISSALCVLDTLVQITLNTESHTFAFKFDGRLTHPEIKWGLVLLMVFLLSTFWTGVWPEVRIASDRLRLVIGEAHKKQRILVTEIEQITKDVLSRQQRETAEAARELEKLRTLEKVEDENRSQQKSIVAKLVGLRDEFDDHQRRGPETKSGKEYAKWQEKKAQIASKQAALLDRLTTLQRNEMNEIDKLGPVPSPDESLKYFDDSFLEMYLIHGIGVLALEIGTTVRSIKRYLTMRLWIEAWGPICLGVIALTWLIWSWTRSPLNQPPTGPNIYECSIRIIS